ncbi:MAG TPA: hypothetical protein VKY85_19545 [Candidatus Angelobacter sp.]|jgi:hypothetical protein|nr:hypothetical protein [Candidatus Angelobacter sp.]
MSNRVLNRWGAREVTAEELDRIQGAANTCFITACGVIRHVADDEKCDL